MRPSRRDPALLLLTTAAVIVVFALMSRVASAPATEPKSVAVATAAPSASSIPTEAPTVAPPLPTPAVAPTPTATAEPAPTESPVPTAAPTRAPTASPTPRPTATAVPTPEPPITIANASGPVPPGSTRYQGTVTDAATGAPLAGVCVYAGPPAGCPSPSLLTDASGRYAVDFPAGLGFSFTFDKDGYLPALRLTGTTINVALVRR